MLAIKLSRFGKKKQPSFRLIVLEKSKDPWGDYLENLGHYDPRTKKAVFNAERVNYWMGKGAKPTDSVHNLLVTSGVLKDKKRAITKISKKRKAKLEKETGEKAAALKAKQEKAKAEAAAKDVKPETPDKSATDTPSANPLPAGEQTKTPAEFATKMPAVNSAPDENQMETAPEKTDK